MLLFIYLHTLGGEGGIRTPVPTRRETTFEAAAFNRSATSPKNAVIYVYYVNFQWSFQSHEHS